MKQETWCYSCIAQCEILPYVYVMLKHCRKCCTKNKARGVQPNALFSYSTSKAML